MNNHNGDTQFSPEVHVLADTLRPRCVDQHLVVQWLRGVARTSSSLGHHKNLPTSEVAQWHEQSTRVTFWLSTVDIWERNKELIRKRTDIGEHFTQEIIQSIVFIFLPLGERVHLTNRSITTNL